MKTERILVAMSGGVDSSVAALVLQREGHEVVGAYMKNWINEDNIAGDCPWMRDIEDARAVADRLGIEFRVVNLMRDYRRLVVDYLLEGYQRGLTPNPDVMCNREMKFGVLAEYARKEGFAAVATGHYARRLEVGRAGPPAVAKKLAAAGLGPPQMAPDGGPSFPPHSDPRGANGPALPPFSLLEGADKNKDQSYFLALLSPTQLQFARFPIGHLQKPALRRLATEAGLPNAGKKDSQGICFIGEVKMTDFLRAYVPEQPGPIVRASDGRVLGEHRGLHYFTIGQRRGIRVPSNTDNEAYVVVGKRADDRALLVDFDGPKAPGLWTTEARVHSLSFLAEPLTSDRQLECRVRYRDPRVAAEFVPEENGGARILFSTPQRALAPGQILALYDGERLLGGGVFA
ncbi:MAG TPA: tRNA 2-thiouridine(34) synthase MnmA [Candidatus Didemnitutus sp.]|nr:tRNA 2-thiouridine(34) synthase MnmA [Candidatus Didemnitutus sp.]